MAASLSTRRLPALVRQVAQRARAQRLFEPGDRILVAVSGGADSVCLLSVLAALMPTWQLQLSVVHFHHGLRGAEADGDADFVGALCRRLDVPSHRERLVLPARAGRSLQDLARQMRYEALGRLSRALGANRVALGHTRDDQAETIVMWWLRGAAAGGLSGMPAARDGLFIRPLLELTRAEIERYLTDVGLTFRDDSSNGTMVYLRNRIRHDLLPRLRHVNPAIVNTLARQADVLREENDFLDRLAAEELEQMGQDGTVGDLFLDRSRLLTLPVALQRRIVRMALQRVAPRQYSASFRSIALVLKLAMQAYSDRTVILRGAVIGREYGRIRIAPAAQEARQSAGASEGSVPLPVPGSIRWPPTGQRITTDLVHSVSMTPGSTVISSPTTALVDADTVTLPLAVRQWRSGDRFQPLGMPGHHRKLQDFFADLKVPRRERTRIPLVVAPEGIVWVAGHRLDDRFKLTERTTRLLRVTVSTDETQGRVD